jgi:cytidyltransferase-like protein
MRKIWHITDLANVLAEEKKVVVSGGFDPIHVGHVRYIQAASELPGKLVVLVNGDSFLLRKKGYVFMPLAERMEVVAAISGVDYVVPWESDSQDVSDALAILLPNVFAKGGDRSGPEMMDRNELDVCTKLGIDVVYGIGGEKIQSSSKMVEKTRR